MKNTMLILFSNDFLLLPSIQKSIPSTLDLWTLPFERRDEILQLTQQVYPTLQLTQQYTLLCTTADTFKVSQMNICAQMLRCDLIYPQ